MGGGLIMSLIGIYVEWVLYGLVLVLIAAIVLGANNYAVLRRTSVAWSREDVPETLSAEATASITTLVTPFDTIPTTGRPAPVMTMVDHLPRLQNLRLLVTPDTVGSVPGVDRRDALIHWLATHRPHLAIDVQLLDARVSPFAFCEGEDVRLSHALSAAKSLGGVVVDVTGGTKVMSIVALRAAEAAAVPVTYLVQPPAGQPTDSFYGMTLLSDPEAMFQGSEAS